MFGLRRVGQSNSSSKVARQRLLCDPTLRRNQTPVMRETDGLSPDEQLFQAAEIARGFPGHYLADVSYIAERQITVAIAKPIRPNKYQYPTEIWIDPIGNTSIRRIETPNPADKTGRRLTLLALGGLTLLIAIFLV
jgi:hypothetical protein